MKDDRLVLNDPLEDVEQYSDKLSISRMLKVLERCGVFMTKTMVHHYLRFGLLPEAGGRRIYGADHMRLLVMIDSLKGIFSLDEIKTLFAAFHVRGAEGGLVPYNVAILYESFLQMRRRAAEILSAEAGEHALLYYMAAALAARQAAEELIAE